MNYSCIDESLKKNLKKYIGTVKEQVKKSQENNECPFY